MEYDDHYLFNNNLSAKLNLICFASLNNKIKINNDPIPYLFKDFSDVESLFVLNNFTKIFYSSANIIHNILYDYDQIIKITEKMCNNLSFNYYLSLLIKAESEIINYEFNTNYIKLFNENQKSEDFKYFNLIKSKIIIDLINNLKNESLYEEDENGEFVSKLEKENKEYIKNNIYIFKEIKINLSEEDIYDINVEELYVNIIIALIKNNKLRDFEYSYNIFKQLDMENIDINFLESENLLNQIKEVLDSNNEYIKNNIINNFEDVNDISKINFHYLLLKFIFKSSLYIYQIPLLLEAHKMIIKILKLKNYITFTLTNQIFIDRIDFIFKKLSNLDYYYGKEYLNKKQNLGNDNFTYIKSMILTNSKIIFDISINKKINPEVKKIECFYDKENSISFDEMMKLQEKNSENENKLELNINFNLYLNYICSCKNVIETQINKFQFDYNFKLYIELKKILSNNTNNIFNINAEYKIQDHPFYKIDINSIEENILLKKNNELDGLNSLMRRINFDFDSEKSTLYKSTALYSKITEMLQNSTNDIDKISTSNVLEEINEELMDYQILKFEKLIFKHDNLKFFLPLKNGDYFSCGNETIMVLYDQNFNILAKLNIFNDIIYNIIEINDKKNSVELFASYGKCINTIEINKNNFEVETKMYEVPNMKTLFCGKVNENDYILGGINGAMKIMDLFNFNSAEKKMYKLINFSIKTGLVINEQYVALISNEIIPKGANLLAICDLYKNKAKHLITDYSFNLSENSLSLIKFENDEIILLCACKKYKSNQRNGILIVNMNLIEGENVKYKFYETNNFVPYCFTQIFTTIFILIGGFNLDKCRGEIRLYMIKKRDINEFIYVQDIEIIDDEYNNFYGIAMPINNLIQTKNSGKIVVTTIDGHVFLFSKPNLDYYNKKNKR